MTVTDQVTEENEKLGVIDCPICGEECELKASRKYKRPTFSCKGCGFQGISKGGKSCELIKPKQKPQPAPADDDEVIDDDDEEKESDQEDSSGTWWG